VHLEIARLDVLGVRKLHFLHLLLAFLNWNFELAD
jgi:hypothetical protein